MLVVYLLSDAIVGVGDDDVSSAGRDEHFAATLAVVDIVFFLLVGSEIDGKPFVSASFVLEVKVAAIGNVVVVDASVCPEWYFQVYGIRANGMDGVVTLYFKVVVARVVAVAARNSERMATKTFTM